MSQIHRMTKISPLVSVKFIAEHKQAFEKAEFWIEKEKWI